MKRFLSPKQAAKSLGVSESSLKRWCDRGSIDVQITVGGHRKIPITAIVQFVRETRRELVRPELLGLQATRTTDATDLTSSVEPLADTLAQGDAENAAQLVLGHFLNGQSVAKLCDDLFAPALAIIGNRWHDREIEIYEEHQSVQLMYQMLAELQGLLPDARPDAPVAIGGSPEHDVYGLPTRMIAVALREAGWKATSLGTSLPFSTLLAATQKCQPQLVWLSVSVLVDPKSFRVKLSSFASEIGDETSLVIGGRGVPGDLRRSSGAIIHCNRVQTLIESSQPLSQRTLRHQEILQ